MLKVQPFYLMRYEDVNGKSGTGIVGMGVVLPSGRAVLEWTTFTKSLNIYDTLDQLKEIHGHEGCTEIIMGIPCDQIKTKKTRKKKNEA